MISQSGKTIVQQFVTKTKDLLLKNTITILQGQYGIWQDGHIIPVEKLSTKDTEVIHIARMLRERLMHISNSLPDTASNKDKTAVEQLVAEQAFTILNRFCALRMCEERELIFESIRNGYNSAGFESYDAVTGGGAVGNRFTRYKWYIYSIFDELSVELPAVFNRFSPYCLIFPDETTLLSLLDLINAKNLTAFYDEQTGETINFWKEDETIGWIYQYYNSLEERRKMREESNKPRNSREMAVRNQFFTPEYVVKFLTDNTLGRIWFEMTGGKSKIYEFCEYMVHKPNEVIEKRELKEPTEIRTMDPTCGSMHFGLYAFGVYEYIYMDAWDNQPNLLQEYRYALTRDEFQKLVPSLILEKNIYGCEIDPRALQMAALSLWLRAQRAYNEMSLHREDRPLIKHSNLILAEPMPGNKKMLKILMSEFDAPMQRLITKIWDKMQYVGEAGLLIKMEQEIDKEIADLRKNWYRVNKIKDISLFSSTKEEEWAENERIVKLHNAEAKEAFFAQVTERLLEALRKISEELSADEGYENALFTEDATRGFAFIELCQQRFDVIVMNPPFGAGSESTFDYLETNYPLWGRNLVCAFFDRMREMLTDSGKLGAIYDRTVIDRKYYETFRLNYICGYINTIADTGWNVLDANVETSTIVLRKNFCHNKGVFIDLRTIERKSDALYQSISHLRNGIYDTNVYIADSSLFLKLVNAIIGYDINPYILAYLNNKTFEDCGYKARKGHDFHMLAYPRKFYEVVNSDNYRIMYNGGSFTMFYKPYSDVVLWDERRARVDSRCNLRNMDFQELSGTGFGEYGIILDAHILAKGCIFTQEGQAISNITPFKSYISTSFLNSSITQYVLNVIHSGLHKVSGYINLLPMPNYDGKTKEIYGIVSEAIELKRYWSSFDETNLEYRGLISQIPHPIIQMPIVDLINYFQERINRDTARYEELVRCNDYLWMDLAGISAESDFGRILNDYIKNRTPEELFTIDKVTTKTVINDTVFAQEIIQEIVGFVFGRWDISYVLGKIHVPEFGDIFDPLPFMPVVSLDKKPATYPLDIPADGILVGDANNPHSIVRHVREAIQVIWGDKANDIEYELCQLIGYETLQDYFDSPQGFFDYHFKRYTKSRRKAPIYWPISTEHGEYTIWVYYPKLSQNTLPKIVLMLGVEIEEIRSKLTSAQLKHDKVEENRLRITLTDLEGMVTSLHDVIDLPYKPNHDDGVPVTAAPLAGFFAHTQWRNECNRNLECLNKGIYDWSHLAFSMFPLRIREKAKKDWCMALTHGLEELCEKKPKEKKSRTRSTPAEDSQPELF